MKSTKLCIIPCGNKKIWDKHLDAGPTVAKEAYIGTFHRLCEQYADHFQLDWVVLSAKHGFLYPDDWVVGPYDLSFNHKGKAIISMERLQEQVKDKGLDKYAELVLLTGKKYRPIVHTCFPEHPVQYPLQDCPGIGYMQKKLKESIESGMPIHE
ncbi:hypothetical protein KO561_07850 [Radiobacillus kanasensis]|uniref:DUF6884 domain-containing protein n=1 Tax=Radiobacillus kanasensis TaxID=2844358 RepID=UPI001E41002B|nr:DUF6884 domain-containing protein [Radiobacillus kanasensis]UFU00834.1 hypothetical protein KO561_07850 [Radiobacillus kanasensis]